MRLYYLFSMECIYCKAKSIKKGIRNNVQQYQCKRCKKYFRKYYRVKRLTDTEKRMLVTLLKVGVGVRGISRVLGISPTAVLKQLLSLSREVIKPVFPTRNQVYEADELRTYIGNKENECWISYILNRTTGDVEDYVVGSRSKKNIGSIILPLLERSPARIYTDKLNIYRGLIPKEIHRVFERCTNKIERHNLTLRTHLKRFSRKTICFSRSPQMLEASLKLYFWG